MTIEECGDQPVPYTMDTVRQYIGYVLAELQPEIDGGVHDPSDYVKVEVQTDDGVVEVTVPKGSPFAYTLDNKTGWEPAAVGKQVRTLFVVNDDGANERPASSREILKMLRFGKDPDNMRDG